ncbi:MAG: PEP-CTERM sorting domain-containing protein [Verrucomicrobia bacterium]|nr:PEP-CTERM sorting domain-containing protein [Verrucomicrobiota bacterium]
MKQVITSLLLLASTLTLPATVTLTLQPEKTEINEGDGGWDVPIYNTVGELVAENLADLWDGSIRNHVCYTQYGELSWFRYAATGTKWNGETATWSLGTSIPEWALTYHLDQKWIDYSYGDYRYAKPLYGISGVIVPEPSSLALLALGGVVIRRRRQPA